MLSTLSECNEKKNLDDETFKKSYTNIEECREYFCHIPNVFAFDNFNCQIGISIHLI